jgi:hypothetical protein
MDISRNAATAKGPAETFTGDVCVDPSPPGVATLSAERRRGPLHTQGAQRLAFHDGGQTRTSPKVLGLAQVRGQRIV